MKRKEGLGFEAAALACFVLLMTGGIGLGAEYPAKPITLINANPPGGFVDIVGRAFASVAEEHLGQPVVVLNKPGASGMIGGTAALQAAPDGYTVMLGFNSITCTIEWEIASGRKPAFTRHDFVTLGSLVLSPTLLVVPFESPWKTVKDLVQDVKAKPRHFAFCSGGLYGNTHVAAELFLRAASVEARHVPYQGGSPCLSALVGKHIDFASQFPPTSVPLAQGKKVRILAVQGKKRLKSIPDVPTVKELGIDAEYYNWVGVLVPKKTPPPAMERLRQVTEKAARGKRFAELIEKSGDEVYYMSGEELGKYWAAESEMIAGIYQQFLKEKGR